MSETRPPILDEAKLTPEQQAVFEKIRSGPRGLVQGPLRIWLQSSAFAEQAQSLGAFCRYGTSLPPRLSELAILVVGAHWRSGFEWHVHAPIAESAGVGRAAIEAIKRGASPLFEKVDEQVLYTFVAELVATRQVSDENYARAIGQFGVKTVVELVGILGYYTLISMTINVFRVPVPEGEREPFQAETHHDGALRAGERP